MKRFAFAFLFLVVALISVWLFLARNNIRKSPRETISVLPVSAQNPGRKSSHETSSVWPLLSQEDRTSPHETTQLMVDGNRITIVYGRPYSKNPETGEIRKIWGTLVPYDKVWRMGADEATLFITQQPIMLGNTTVSPGAYTLWLLLAKDGPAMLIVNKQIGQWGIKRGGVDDGYHEILDLLRVDLKKEPLNDPVDQFTIAIVQKPAGGGVLKLMWENTQFSVPFTVKK